MDKNDTLNRIFLFVGILLLFFFSSLFQIIPIKLLHLNIKEITSNQNILLTIFSNTVTVILLIIIFRKDLKEEFSDFKSNYKTQLDVAFKIWVIGLVLMAVFNSIIGKINPNDVANNEQAVRSMLKVNPWAMVINTGLLAPIVEELVFRKSFRVTFKNNLAFILISGLVFGALHVVLSVDNLYDYLYLLPYCSLGIAFSYMYYKTKNIFAPISMHIIHNLIITLLNIFLVGVIL